MTMVLQAGGASVVMPNPDFGNAEGRDLSLDAQKSMDGTLYSYVQSSGRRTFSYTWSDLGRGKIVEVQEFFKLFAGVAIQLIDHRGTSWLVIFKDATIDASVDSRSAGSRRESGSITLDFLQDGA